MLILAFGNILEILSLPSLSWAGKYPLSHSEQRFYIAGCDWICFILFLNRLPWLKRKLHPSIPSVYTLFCKPRKHFLRVPLLKSIPKQSLQRRNLGLSPLWASERDMKYKGRKWGLGNPKPECDCRGDMRATVALWVLLLQPFLFCMKSKHCYIDSLMFANLKPLQLKTNEITKVLSLSIISKRRLRQYE